ncbi:unnamed protein product [Ilex paraguariensis]|uniref:DUF3444 domain-containing protein n=1 Tax=Ilex paraguariensis TaxID=185542 RepID=A0ABC8QPB6_9AQUA
MEPSIAAKAAHVVQQANERLKRERQETQATAEWETHSKKRSILDEHGNLAYQTAMGTGHVGTGSVSGDGVYGFRGINNKPNSTRELTPFEIRNMLMEKARTEICKKLTQWRSENAAAETEKKKAKESKKEKEKRSLKGPAHDPNGTGVSFATKTGDQANKSVHRATADGKNTEDLAPVSMNVPDPDFHDFDLDRTESSFEDNQVWAAYDDDDGMPRFYAMVHNVISRKPFKMRISWLNSKTNSEFGPADWVGSGFYKTCGEFRVGKHEIYMSLNCFSQRVKWTKGARGTVHIYPQKGDVWALYRNWSRDWNERTPDEVIHKYDMVEVLDDYQEEQGVSVTPLIKVAGYRTVFHPDLDPDKARRIPKEEMFRFSHIRCENRNISSLEFSLLYQGPDPDEILSCIQQPL